MGLRDIFWHRLLQRPYTLAARIKAGRGQPVVLLHGIAATAEGWEYTSSLLDHTKYQVVAFDLLGFGKSPQPHWLQYSVDDHAKAVVASLRQQKIKQPVILVGHSMGALVALRIAHDYPKLVKRLVLYQMPVYSETSGTKVRDIRLQTYISFFTYMADHPKVTLRLARMMGHTASKIAGFVLNESTWLPFEMSMRNTILNQKSFQNLRELTMPTAVVYGRYDFVVLRKYLIQLFRPNDNLRFYSINDTHRISPRAAKAIYELVTTGQLKSRRMAAKRNQKPPAERATIHSNNIMATSKTLPKTVHRNRAYVVIITLAIVVFAWCAAVASQHTVTGWELDVFRSINGAQLGDVATHIAKALSDSVWAALGVIGLVFLISKKYRFVAWRVGVSAVATYIIVFVAETIIGRARPDVLLHADSVIRAAQGGMGFPSGHTATIVAIVVSLWILLRWPLRLLGVLLIIGVAWSRVYLGVHFPLDIIGGAALGIAVPLTIQLLPEAFLQKVKLREKSVRKITDASKESVV